MSPSRPPPWQSHRRVHPYLDCGLRQRPWGRTSRPGRAGSRPAMWPQGWAGESLQVHTLWPPPGGLPDGDPWCPILDGRAMNQLRPLSLTSQGLKAPKPSCHECWDLGHLTAEVHLGPFSSAGHHSLLSVPLSSAHTIPTPASHCAVQDRRWGFILCPSLGLPSPGLHFVPSQEPGADRTAGAHQLVTHLGDTEWAWSYPGDRSDLAGRGLLRSHRWDLGQTIPECSGTLHRRAQTLLPGQAGDSRSL